MSYSSFLSNIVEDEEDATDDILNRVVTLTLTEEKLIKKKQIRRFRDFPIYKSNAYPPKAQSPKKSHKHRRPGESEI